MTAFPGMGRAPLELDTLIFFVTSRCNSKCRTCFYWDELNAGDDLTFAEIERVSTTMPRFNELWLSGGEPTLREELVEVLSLFYRQNGVRSVNFPANGLLPDRLVGMLEATFAACPELRVNLNLALDGIGATHDSIRGVPGNFERALESLEGLQGLRDRVAGLRLHANSVVCRENLAEMVPLGEMMRDRFDLDGHYFQIIRGEPMDPGLLEVHKESLVRLYADLQPLYHHYAEKLGRRKGWVGRAGYLGVLNLYHDIQAANFDRHHRWPMPCTAAQNIAVLDANGDIRSCELRQRLGNVREYECDWRRFWDSPERQAEIAGIRKDGCWCTHVCFIHSSLKASRKAQVVDVPLAYLSR
jgi:MoaA/NifB/PqqE/SkfB family radical SAM enzyme